MLRVGAAGGRPRAGVNTLRGTRPGVCRRCGWRSIFGKVRRYGLSATSCGRAYARLCDECISDIYHGFHTFPQVSPAVLHEYKP
jgi:hypothetical protein